MGRPEHNRLDNDVIADEIGRVRIVCQDASHLGGSQDHAVRAFHLEEGLDSGLVEKVQFVARSSQDLGIAPLLEASDKGRTYQAPMTRNKNTVCFFNLRHTANWS
jgi:hypothetical protein